MPRAVDGFEIAVRAIVGQQISVAGAITVLGRLIAAAPDADELDPVARSPTIKSGSTTGRQPPDRRRWTMPPFGAGLAAVPRPGDRGQAAGQRVRDAEGRIATIRALAEAINADEVVLDGSVDRDETRAALESIPGIGPWTASYVAMRALGDPDVFLPSDVAVRRAARAIGLPDKPVPLTQHAERWAPWRSYAVIRLWRM